MKAGSPTEAATDARTLLISLTGDLDMASAHEVGAAVASALDGQPPDRIDVDLAGVPFLDSAGILALLRAQQRAAERGCRLLVRNPVRTVLRVMQIAGVDELLLGPAAALPGPPAGAHPATADGSAGRPGGPAAPSVRAPDAGHQPG